jgi:hypothetical protein
MCNFIPDLEVLIILLLANPSWYMHLWEKANACTGQRLLETKVLNLCTTDNVVS